MITRIKIKNIRGFGDKNNEINLEIKPNKLNLLMAPNGFGKSSIFKAFENLQETRLNVDVKDKYLNNEFSDEQLVITENGLDYIADSNRNDLFNEFNVYCINSPLSAKLEKRFVGSFLQTISFLAISNDAPLLTIPAKTKLNYSIRTMRSILKHKPSIMFNLTGNKVPRLMFQKGLSHYYKEMDDLTSTINQEKITTVIQCYNARDLKSLSKKLVSLYENESYTKLYKYINEYINDEMSCFMVIYQIVNLFKKDKANFKQWIFAHEFDNLETCIRLAIADTCLFWEPPILYTKRRKKNQIRELYISFPKAENISNGERDLMCLVIKLSFLIHYKENNKRNIVVIDEVFDYLDECNMTVVQYYLSRLLHERIDYNDYFILLTHLSSRIFDTYVLNGKINPISLLPEPNIKKETKRMLCRETLPIELNDYISHYLLHFTDNEETDYTLLMREHRLKESWGNPRRFKLYLVREVNNYLNTTETYDPYAICIAVRVYIERQVYSQLPRKHRKKFINIFTTQKKLTYAEKYVDISDMYYLLSIIYNEACHINHKDLIPGKSIVHRLRHSQIRKMIALLFQSNKDAQISIEHFYKP